MTTDVDGDVWYVFNLRQDGEGLAPLVEAVPNGWSGVTGCVELLPTEGKEVVSDVGYLFHGVTQLDCLVVSAPEKDGRRKEPKYLELIGEVRRVSFIRFDAHNPYPTYGIVDRARAVAAKAVRDGYRGTLHFRLDDDRQCTKAVIRFFFDPSGWCRVAVGLFNRSTAELSDEDKACIDPFLSACRALSLQQGLQEETSLRV